MLREVLDVLDFMTSPKASAADFEKLLPAGAHRVKIDRLDTERGSMEFVKILFPGSRGKSSGGDL